MPGWHAATQALRNSGDLQMLGIIQEQNADRCRLFMQWQEMDWPILVDSFNLLKVSVVPLTYAIDEHGIVRFAGLRQDALATLADEFVHRSFPAGDPPSARSVSPEEALAIAALGDVDLIDRAIEHYRGRIVADPGDGWSHFRLAVGYRLRYDSAGRRRGDFQKSVDHWQAAVELDPNNYIWRRRIQQYGPRLDKPYPFYDWIEAAQQEIRARGDEPAELTALPTGSEIAAPQRGSSGSADPAGKAANPDPEDRVYREAGATEDRFIHIEPTAVPRQLSAGQVSRLHLVFRPNSAKRAHWNNESEPLTVWLSPPEGWRVSQRLLTHDAVPDAATSEEVRRLEVEISAPDSSPAGRHSVPAYALYYVCEDAQGTCLYRRQDFEVTIELR